MSWNTRSQNKRWDTLKYMVRVGFLTWFKYRLDLLTVRY